MSFARLTEEFLAMGLLVETDSLDAKLSKYGNIIVAACLRVNKVNVCGLPNIGSLLAEYPKMLPISYRFSRIYYFSSEITSSFFASQLQSVKRSALTFSSAEIFTIGFPSANFVDAFSEKKSLQIMFPN